MQIVFIKDAVPYLVDTTYEKMRAGQPVTFDDGSSTGTFVAESWLAATHVYKWKSVPDSPDAVKAIKARVTLKESFVGLPTEGRLAKILKAGSPVQVWVELTDLLNHSDIAFRQELIREAFHPGDWEKVFVTTFAVVGLEAPGKLLVEFSVKGRTKLK